MLNLPEDTLFVKKRKDKVELADTATPIYIKKDFCFYILTAPT